MARASQLLIHGAARALPSTIRVSVGSNGVEGNGSSSRGSSANDRFVAYYSSATNLVPGDSNRATDVFVFVARPRSTSA
jgi:hypothetical protein